ncbi:Uncharacterized protein Adt_39274 [Abeliophyllum distichum]|uniref:Uncharacterized protein n=1 Tax=Abeliophyllum distichum TaxID=126358 RepID=A0ABD1Q4M0_9LAMI
MNYTYNRGRGRQIRGEGYHPAPRTPHQANKRRPNEQPPAVQPSVREINTIMDISHIGRESNNVQRFYIRMAKRPMHENYWVCREMKLFAPTITFRDEDEANNHYSHYNALVVLVVIAQNTIKHMLVDNKSLVNILFGNVINQIEVDHP